MFHNAGHAVVILSTVAVVFGFLIWAEDEARLGRHIVVISSDHGELPAVRAEVRRLRDAGFSITTDLDAAVLRLEADDSDVTIFAITRPSIAQVPEGLLGDLYGRGVVVIALDVAMRELMLHVHGYEGGTGMLPYTPERPVFSMMRSTCGRSSLTSDWLGIFDIPVLAIERSSENCPSSN
jgi:hypothetical protein